MKCLSFIVLANILARAAPVPCTSRDLCLRRADVSTRDNSLDLYARQDPNGFDPNAIDGQGQDPNADGGSVDPSVDAGQTQDPNADGGSVDPSVDAGQTQDPNAVDQNAGVDPSTDNPATDAATPSTAAQDGADSSATGTDSNANDATSTDASAPADTSATDANASATDANASADSSATGTDSNAAGTDSNANGANSTDASAPADSSATGTDSNANGANSTDANAPAADANTAGANCASTPPTINGATVSLIKQFEGFVASPAPDPIGLPTVGFGHKCQQAGCTEVPFSFPLSQDTATSLLQTDAQTFTNCLSSLVGPSVTLNDNQFGALTSFAFNLGCGTVKTSTLLKRLNAGEDPNTVAAQEIPRFNKAGGKVLKGLSSRRAAEVSLFQTPSTTIAHPLC